MTFAGLASERARADLIAFLDSLSANPVPLPKAENANGGAAANQAPGPCSIRQFGTSQGVKLSYQADRHGSVQAFAFNIQREKFQDARARLAFNYAFDFEKMNKLIFYGQYKRIASYFEKLQLLETVRDKVPREVFEKPYSNPINDSPAAWRPHLPEAARLFKAAGYEVFRRRLVNGNTGEPYEVELLSDDTSFERVFLFYSNAAIGVRRRPISLVCST